MQAIKKMFSFTSRGSGALLSKSVTIFLSLLTLASISLQAQKAVEEPAGIAWRVRGTWQAEGNGAQILAGDAVQPGSLLLPGEGTANRSITILLPDGQRVLYECFTVEDCSRGFRVPSLYRKPEPFAVDMLARIHSVLVGGNPDSTGSGIHQAPHLPRDEVVAVLDPDNRVDVAGLSAKLSDGHYTFDLQPFDPVYPRQFHLALEKRASFLSLALPSSGLYVLTITDALNTPRIDLLIAAIRPAQAASFKKFFGEAHAQMEKWNEYYQGWPIHDFQRAYLQSLMAGGQADSADRQAGVAGKHASGVVESGGLDDTAKERAGVTAEPSFFPKPGLFAGDTAVTLRSNVQGIAIHFTVDGSQPVASSPVYGAPIMVKGTELTIKSFASAAGRKDSAVVTGIFRIQE